MSTLELEANLKLYYTVDDHTDPWSDPDTVVFVNGFTENTAAWRCWVPHFSRHYRVVRYDQRGFGQSGPVSADFTFTTELLVRDLENLIRTISPNRPVHLITGKSGGIPAMMMAVTNPGMVQSLTMSSPAIKGPETRGWLEHIDQHGMASWSRWTMGERLGSKMPAAGIDWWANMMGLTAPSTAHAYLRWVAGVDLNPKLGSLTCPTLIVCNESKRRGLAQFRVYQQSIPSAEMVVIDVDGYHTAAVAPDLCSAATLSFIHRHSKGNGN